MTQLQFILVFVRRLYKSHSLMFPQCEKKTFFFFYGTIRIEEVSIYLSMSNILHFRFKLLQQNENLYNNLNITKNYFLI